MAADLLVITRKIILQKEMEARQRGVSFGVKEAWLKAETLKLLERQEKFLNDFDAGDPVEIAPGHNLRKFQ